MVGGFLLILLIFLFGIFTVVSLVFAIIYFAGSRNGKFIWLGLFLFSLAGLIVSIFYTVNRITNKAVNFANKVQESFIKGMDSTTVNAYNFADSLNSAQLKYLRLIEPRENEGEVPEQFYNYLGFRDYYRLPLRYPFSIHCIDMLDKGSLYNEKSVRKFDENDNGEQPGGVDNIKEFIFDENILIARQSVETERKQVNNYIIYHFNTGKSEKLGTIDEVIARAQALGFTRGLKFVSCKDYYGLL
jgi:hypothetical protein